MHFVGAKWERERSERFYLCWEPAVGPAAAASFTSNPRFLRVMGDQEKSSGSWSVLNGVGSSSAAYTSNSHSLPFPQDLVPDTKTQLLLGRVAAAFLQEGRGWVLGSSPC